MWMALSKIAVCFMTAYGRGIYDAKRLLGSELAGVLVTDQYVAYRFIDASQRQLCWAHVLRNVAAIGQSGEEVNQFVGARLVLLCSGQLNPDTWLGRSSAFAGGIPSLC
jgi:transposase